ncbi:hypothetical protein OIT44_03945 [Weissella ceti]|uniref:Uncharacterized protein n=1 Tax=Weissella ceti TaxID=759620 RepID=A0ABT3E468_9LACO|nr:hypothetical protein [Weissella ceti]MCW0953226.1 hypothetical protein [Weissella ceti]QVK12742.1 hypothetical protein KHQ31_03705 [Weissella ceti]
MFDEGIEEKVEAKLEEMTEVEKYALFEVMRRGGVEAALGALAIHKELRKRNLCDCGKSVEFIDETMQSILDDVFESIDEIIDENEGEDDSE